MVKIFDASVDARIILNEVLENGLARICVGRVKTREKLGEVAMLAEEEGHETVHAVSTINHPDTELAFPYDESRYQDKEAKKAVERAYRSSSP